MVLFLYLFWFSATILTVVSVGNAFNDPSAILIGLMVWVAFPIYFLPSFVAAHRYMVHKFPLFLGNLFFGGTGIGWAIVLILAFMGRTEFDGNEPVNSLFR